MKILTSTLVLAFVFLSPPIRLSANTDEVIFRVTSVRQEDAKDWCKTGKCVATQYTVEGYRAAKSTNQVIRYLLECVETRDSETLKIMVGCPRVQADEEYSVKLVADAMLFPHVPPPNDGITAGYAIRSQKVENK